MRKKKDREKRTGRENERAVVRGELQSYETTGIERKRAQL